MALTQVHIGRPIANIIKERVEKMKHNINRVIRIKEMDLNEKVRRLDKVFVHMKYLANYFKTSTENFFEGIVHDMKAAHEKKRGMVGTALRSIQEDLHRIRHLIFETNYLTDNGRHVELLDSYSRLIKQAEHLYFKKHEGRSDPHLALNIDPKVYADVPNALSEIIKAREQCEYFKSLIHTMNCMFVPVTQRRLDAQKFIDIQISPTILKNLEKELA